MATDPSRVLHRVEVLGVRDVAPHMRRITMGGNPLRSMVAELPGQWMKVFFPVAPGERRHGRAYTIRRHDPTAGTMELDFVLHGDDGLASRWAGQARAGETLEVAGPRQGYKVDLLASGQLLIGDSTALPAIACILETLPTWMTPSVFVEVADEAEGRLLPAHPAGELKILVSGDRIPGTTRGLEQAVRSARLPTTPQVWIAGEATMMRAVRQHLVDERGVDPHSVEASGYWKAGAADHRD